MAYDKADQHQALNIFGQCRNKTQTAEETGISRQTIVRWAKEGIPEEVTGGKTWTEHWEARDRDRLAASKQRELEKSDEGAVNFFDQQQERVKKLLDTLFHRLEDEQGGEMVNARDFETLMDLYIKLDNQHAEKVRWMRGVALAMVNAVAEEVDEATLLRVKSRLLSILNQEQQKMGPLPDRDKQLVGDTPAQLHTDQHT
jgi:hypothetical protein